MREYSTRRVCMLAVLCAALLSAACDRDCDCLIAGPSPVQPPPSCSVPVLTVELAGRTVVGTWTATDVQLVIEEESGERGNYIPLQTPGHLTRQADGFRWTAAKDGRYRFTATNRCGTSSQIRLVSTQPPYEPPTLLPPPTAPPSPPVPPCTASWKPHPGC